MCDESMLIGLQTVADLALNKCYEFILEILRSKYPQIVRRSVYKSAVTFISKSCKL